MSLSAFWSQLEELPISQHIGESWWFPLLESIHVVAITLVVGSILMVDLRLIGVAARGYRVSRMSNEIVPWTWVAFIVAVVTGIGLFVTRAATYMENPAFQIKLVLIALAGVNMMLFHFGVFRGVASWDESATPGIAKASAALSLLFWSGVILAGRWTGHLS